MFIWHQLDLLLSDKQTWTGKSTNHRDDGIAIQHGWLCIFMDFFQLMILAFFLKLFGYLGLEGLITLNKQIFGTD